MHLVPCLLFPLSLFFLSTSLKGSWAQIESTDKDRHSNQDYRYYLKANADSRRVEFVVNEISSASQSPGGDLARPKKGKGDERRRNPKSGRTGSEAYWMKLTTSTWNSWNELSNLDLAYGAPSYTLLEWQREDRKESERFEEFRRNKGEEINKGKQTDISERRYEVKSKSNHVAHSPLTKPSWFHFDVYLSVLDGSVDVFIADKAQYASPSVEKNMKKDDKTTMIRGDLLWLRAGTIFYLDEESIQKNTNLTLSYTGGPFNPIYIHPEQRNTTALISKSNRVEDTSKIRKTATSPASSSSSSSRSSSSFSSSSSSFSSASTTNTIPLLLPETKGYHDLPYRFYLGNEVEWIPDSHIEGGGGQCRDPVPGNTSEALFPPGSIPESANGCDGIWKPLTDSDPSMFRVHWNTNRNLAAHYHGEGALYLVYWGTLCFTGERCIEKGEARWVRPGYRYAGEYSKEDGVEIMVLNVDTVPNFDYQPNSKQDFIITKHKATNFVSK